MYVQTFQWFNHINTGGVHKQKKKKKRERNTCVLSVCNPVLFFFLSEKEEKVEKTRKGLFNIYIYYNPWTTNGVHLCPINLGVLFSFD